MTDYYEDHVARVHCISGTADEAAWAEVRRRAAEAIGAVLPEDEVRDD